MAKVKAMVMEKPGKLELREFEKPHAPEDGLLLKVKACGICGTDKHMMTGKATWVKFPVIPGHEFVGVVEELGPKANDTMNVIGGPLKVGDRIAVTPASKACGSCFYCLNMPHRPQLCSNRRVYGLANCENPPYLLGGFAEYVVVDGRSWAFKIPGNVSDEVASLTEPTSVAMRAVERALNPGEAFSGQGFGAGKSAMVIGAGPIGALVVAALRYMGAGLVIATDFFPKRLEMAKKLGADVVIEGKRPFEERLAEVQKLTSGVGPDVVIEAAGNPKAFEDALTFVRRGGKLIEVGHYTDTGVAEVHPFYICQKDVDIHGSWAYPPMMFKDALDFFSRTSLPVSDLISKSMSLEQLEEGLNQVGTENVHKIVIIP